MAEHRHVYRPIQNDDPQYRDARCDCGDVQTFSRYNRGRIVSVTTCDESGTVVSRHVRAEAVSGS